MYYSAFLYESQAFFQNERGEEKRMGKQRFGILFSFRMKKLLHCETYRAILLLGRVRNFSLLRGVDMKLTKIGFTLVESIVVLVVTLIVVAMVCEFVLVF